MPRRFSKVIRNSRHGFSPPRPVRQWLKLLMGLGAIWLFASVLAPALQSVPWVESVHRSVRVHGIDATGLFYTETEVFFDAEIYVIDSRR